MTEYTKSNFRIVSDGGDIAIVSLNKKNTQYIMLSKDNQLGGIRFQDGPVENGVNGVSSKDLVKLVIDEMESNEKTTPTSKQALMSLKGAITWLDME